MFSIIHRVFLEYFHNCDQNQKAEMIELLSEQLVHMIHTKDGAQVAMECIWYSTAKVDRFCFYFKNILNFNVHETCIIFVIASTSNAKELSKA